MQAAWKLYNYSVCLYIHTYVMNAVHSLFGILVRDSFLLCCIPSERLALYTCHITIVCRIPFISIVRILLISFLCWIHCFFSPLVFLFPDLVPSFVWVGSYYSLKHFTVGLSEPIIMGYLNPINMCYLNQSHSGGILTYSIYPQPLWLPHREVFQSSGPKKWRGWELTVCADFPLLLIWYLIRTFSYFRKICC